MAVAAGACGSDDAANDTLPPMVTTTTTTTLPPTTTTIPATYVVQPGDTLSKIAQKFNLNFNDLAAFNGINPDHIEVGQTLRIPQPGDVIPTTSTTTTAPAGETTTTRR
jgi:LysM repeat protein